MSSDEASGQHLQRSARVSRQMAKVKEGHQRNLLNQRIQTAYIATVERLGDELRSSPAQVVRALQLQFPFLQTKDVQSLHRMLENKARKRGWGKEGCRARECQRTCLNMRWYDR